MAVGSCGGLFAGTATASAGQFTAFPHPPSLTQPALPPDLHTRIGDHVDRQPGEGVEFAGVRPSMLPWTGNERRMPRHPSHSIGKALNTRFGAALMGARADETDALGGSVCALSPVAITIWDRAAVFAVGQVADCAAAPALSRARELAGRGGGPAHH